MTFRELTNNPQLLANPALATLLGIEPGSQIDFFSELQRYACDYQDLDYTNYGHYVVLCDGNVELFQSGTIEVRCYNLGINIFRIVAMFNAAGVEMQFA
ncbi:hypothetical protein [Spirosoma foliorum]|uniref:Uncharacterized protein n=1 Tax=Spirosoma foliorum TaxID=2710596 RepID=A0A7G5H2G5_9BACT|nr:hypothetical protein [Spirosoma foliorum]QMW05307.1 hypothetical protein H3H32_10680 [Spirosoma foliorum]